MQHKNEGLWGGEVNKRGVRMTIDHRAQAQASRPPEMSKSKVVHEKTQLKNQKKKTRRRVGREVKRGSRSVLTSAGRVPERGRGLGQPVVNHRLRLPRQVDRGGRASACRTQHREQSVHTDPVSDGGTGRTAGALGGTCRLQEGELEEAGHSCINL